MYLPYLTMVSTEEHSSAWSNIQVPVPAMGSWTHACKYSCTLHVCKSLFTWDLDFPSLLPHPHILAWNVRGGVAILNDTWEIQIQIISNLQYKDHVTSIISLSVSYHYQYHITTSIISLPVSYNYQYHITTSII